MCDLDPRRHIMDDSRRHVHKVPTLYIHGHTTKPGKVRVKVRIRDSEWILFLPITHIHVETKSMQYE